MIVTHSKTSFQCDTQKYSLTAGTGNVWNSLPTSAADVHTVSLFKAHSDKFWLHQDVKYDFTADQTDMKSVIDLHMK